VKVWRTLSLTQKSGGRGGGILPLAVGFCTIGREFESFIVVRYGLSGPKLAKRYGY
jgi:hypothetical protein